MRLILETSNDSPHVVAPPPLVFAAALLLGLAADGTFGSAGAAHLWFRMGAAVPLLALAAYLIVGALDRFARSGTRPEPWQPTTAIVAAGVYKRTRNPMYLGMALGFAGIAIALDAWLALILLPVALSIVHFGVVLREERYLDRKFGHEYRRYRATVRRWL